MAKLSIIVPEEMKAKILQVSKQEERDMSWVVRKAIEEYLEKYSK